MKRFNSCKKLMASLIVPLTMTTCIVGCSDKENVLNTEEFNKKMEIFNFKTSSHITLSVDLGKAAAKEVVAIFPTEVDVVSANMHVDMLYSAFTDANGSLKTDIELPAAINKVWIVSLTKPSLGVMTAEVQNGKLTVTSTKSAQARRAAANTSTGENGNITTVQDDGTSLTLYNIDDYVIVHEGTITGQTQSQGYKTPSTVSKDDMGTFWCIDKWMPSSDITSTYRYGKTDNTNDLKSTNTTMAGSAEVLWNEESSWARDNLSTIQNFDASQINQHMTGDTTIVENADGSTTTTAYSGSELWVTFIREEASYQNTFGYYIYKTDDQPTTEAKGYALERIVLWPNVSKENQDPYKRTSRQTADVSSNKKDKTINSEDAPLRVGERTQLLFKDPETGAVSKIFPPGYSVGFWFCADAHDPGWNTNGTYCYALKMDYTDNLIFTQNNKRYAPWRWDKNATKQVVNTYFCNSNPDINNNSLLINQDGYKSYNHYVQYNTISHGEEFTLYGIEDGGDASFNDLLFAVSRKDHTEVTNSISGVKLYAEKKYHTVATYAFEDVWPTGGDFDLNDVIVEHDQLQTYTDDNYIHSVRDMFTLVSTLETASQRNAFYVQFPEGEEGNVANMKVTIDGVEVPNRWEAETNSVIVFTDQREAISTGKKVVVVTRDLSEKQYKVHTLTYKPYLIANAFSSTGESQIGQGRTEIHIPGDNATSLGRTLSDKDYYASKYVSEGSYYPFAISLSGVKDWKAPEPAVSIDKTFKKYASWRKANGFADQDWYLNIKGNDYRYKSGSYNPYEDGPGNW